MRCFTVNDTGVVEESIELHQGKKGNRYLPVGDHGRGGKTVYVSQAVVQRSEENRITTAYPAVHENGNIVLNDYHGNTESALVLLRVPAVPGRKRVYYHVDPTRIVVHGRVVRQFGKRFHRWQEMLVVLHPNDTVVVELIPVQPDIELNELIIIYDGTTVTCEELKEPYTELLKRLKDVETDKPASCCGTECCGGACGSKSGDHGDTAGETKVSEPAAAQIGEGSIPGSSLAHKPWGGACICAG